MKENNIFLEDVKVPEIVQKKADRVFLAIRTERSFRMNEGMGKKKIMTGKKAAKAVAAAASLAAVVAAGVLAGPLKDVLKYSDSGAKHALLATADQIDEMFTLRVKAAGTEDGRLVALEEGNQVPVAIGDGKSKSWVICGDDIAGGTVNYCIGLPQITCEGEEIESITYSVNNGAFQIVQLEGGESVITDGRFYEGELDTGSIGGDYNEEREGMPSEPFETLLYQSFTVDYDRQTDARTWINICNERSGSGEIARLLWGDGASEEEYGSGIQKMLDGTVITCTANYKNHTSRSADIKVDSRVMTREETGEPQEEGMDPKEKMTVITFELQQTEGGAR